MPPAVAAVTQIEAVNLLVRSVRVSSVSGSERELAELLCTYARQRGLDTWIDAAGNAHVLVGSPGPEVMLVSHLDTVGGNVPLQINDQFVTGRGSVDAKGSLVAMLVATINLCGCGVRVHWVGVVEEETIESRGAEHLRSTCPPPAALIVGEPSGSSSVTIGYKGKLDVLYSATSDDAHTATPQAKASELAVRFLADITRRYGADGNRRFNTVGLTLCDGRLEPDRTTCVLSFRTHPEHSTSALINELTELLGEQQTIELMNTVPAVVVPRSCIVVTELSSAIGARGMRPRHVLKTGTSDMNTLAQSWEVPMATYGPGDSRLDHSAHEHIRFDEFQVAVGVLQAAIKPIATTVGARGES